MMSDSKQRKADSTSPRPRTWSPTMALVNVASSRTPGASSNRSKGEGVVGPAEPKGQNVSVERTDCQGKGRRDSLSYLPGEVRNTIYDFVYCKDVLPYELNILQVHGKLLPDSSLSSVSRQINRETYLYEDDVTQKFVNNHRFFINFKFEDLRERCVNKESLLELINQGLAHPSFALLRELEIIIHMPYPDSRPGKDANFRIIVLDKPDEDGPNLIFEATCQRRDDNDDGKDDPVDLLKVLGQLQDLAQANASNQEPELTVEAYGCVHLDVRLCVLYLHMLLRSDENRLLHKLTGLVRQDDDEMAVSNEPPPQEPMEYSSPDFSETNSTAEPTSYPEVPPKKKDFGEHHATETQLPSCATSLEGAAAQSQTTKGRQPLNAKRRGR